VKTLYLIRHTTPEIASGTCYGQLDIELNSSFDNEATEVLDCLPAVELIITSPLLRTRCLAEHLAQAHQCEWRSDPRLKEMQFGDWEGKKWDDISRHEVDAWSADTLNYVPPNGESARQMMQRVQEMLRDVEKLPQQTIALVGHGGSIRGVLALLGAVVLEGVLGWEIGYGAVIGVKL
jgi:alpha-ribazole phosphatase